MKDRERGTPCQPRAPQQEGGSEEEEGKEWGSRERGERKEGEAGAGAGGGRQWERVGGWEKREWEMGEREGEEESEGANERASEAENEPASKMLPKRSMKRGSMPRFAMTTSSTSQLPRWLKASHDSYTTLKRWRQDLPLDCAIASRSACRPSFNETCSQ